MAALGLALRRIRRLLFPRGTQAPPFSPRLAGQQTLSCRGLPKERTSWTIRALVTRFPLVAVIVIVGVSRPFPATFAPLAFSTLRRCGGRWPPCLRTLAVVTAIAAAFGTALSLLDAFSTVATLATLGGTPLASTAIAAFGALSVLAAAARAAWPLDGTIEARRSRSAPLSAAGFFGPARAFRPHVRSFNLPSATLAAALGAAFGTPLGTAVSLLAAAARSRRAA